MLLDSAKDSDMEAFTIPQAYDREALADVANEMHERNYNCVQSVSCAFARQFGVDEDLCFRLGEGLGGGLATHTETCGALLGGAMILGLVHSNGCANPTSKEATYELSKKLVSRFRKLHGTTICQEIRALDTTGIKPFPICVDCIRQSVSLTADVLEELAREASSEAGAS